METLPIKEQLKDKVAEVRQVQEEKLQFIGSIRPKKGHTLFEINGKEGTIQPAKLEDQPAEWDHEKKEFKKPRKKVMVKKDCFYISALNEKNALRKFLKL